MPFSLNASCVVPPARPYAIIVPLVNGEVPHEKFATLVEEAGFKLPPSNSLPMTILQSKSADSFTTGVFVNIDDNAKHSSVSLVYSAALCSVVELQIDSVLFCCAPKEEHNAFSSIKDCERHVAFPLTVHFLILNESQTHACSNAGFKLPKSIWDSNKMLNNDVWNPPPLPRNPPPLTAATPIATSAQTPPIEYGWAWLGDHGEWTLYDASESAKIEASYLKGDDKVILYHGIKPLEVRPKENLQVNPSTFFARGIKRLDVRIFESTPPPRPPGLTCVADIFYPLIAVVKTMPYLPPRDLVAASSTPIAAMPTEEVDKMCSVCHVTFTDDDVAKQLAVRAHCMPNGGHVFHEVSDIHPPPSFCFLASAGAD
jgi:hypothetical protein